MLSKSYTNKKDLLFELVRTNFKLRYNNSILGFIWVLLKPFTTFLVLYFVFSKFRGGWVDNYQIYLLTGIIIYTFFNEGIVFGMNGILSTAHIILKVNFPREIALASSLIMSLINFFINILILLIFSIFNPINPTIFSMLYFVFLNIVLFILIYGISFFTSIIIVKLRDLEHITTLGMQLIFYATPIFYPINMLPDTIQKIIALNPLGIIIQAERDAIIHGKISNPIKTVILFLFSLLVLFLGSIFFKKNIKKVAEFF